MRVLIPIHNHTHPPKPNNNKTTPTTGLDSVMAESVFQTLKDLTNTHNQSRIVLATVHCPSSKTYHLFSRLLLLTADGRLAYQGPADDALRHLQAALQWDCPANYNPGCVLCVCMYIHVAVAGWLPGG